MVSVGFARVGEVVVGRCSMCEAWEEKIGELDGLWSSSQWRFDLFGKIERLLS